MGISSRVDVVMADGTPDTTPLDAGVPEAPETVDVAPDPNTPAGMIAAARAGEHVKIGGPTRTASRAVFDAAAEAAGGEATVKRANGREVIEYPAGGRITIGREAGA